MNKQIIYVPIGFDNDWINLDIAYFNDFQKAKKYIETRSKEENLKKIGLDVFDRKKDKYLNMFWEYKNGNWQRNYKD